MIHLCNNCKKSFPTCDARPVFGIDERPEARGVEADTVVKCDEYELRQFRFYITDTMNGEVLGTDDIAFAKETAQCEDYFVVDTLHSEWLLSNGDTRHVKDARRP